jgi:hypothetical protein
MRISKVIGGFGLVVLAVFLQGCAVKTGANGHLLYGLDQAELLGRKIDIFTLPGGGTGALRVMGNQYSLKLDEFSRVIPMGEAKSARVVKVDQVGDRTTVLVVKADNSCDYKYQLFSIKERDVLSWEFYGDCKTAATAVKVDNEQQFDFRLPYQVTRFTYRDSRFLRSDIPLNRLQANPGTSPGGVTGPRYTPGAPSSNASQSPPPDPVKRTATAARSAPTPRTAQAAPQPAKLEFAAEEQKAIRIVLDK